MARLLAQFLHDGAIILSVDESNFKSNSSSGKLWQIKDTRPTLRKVVREHQPEVSDESVEQVQWDQISEQLSY